MKITKAGILAAALILAASAASPGLAADDIWKVPVTVSDSAMSNTVFIGGSRGATDGYDPLEDADAYVSGNMYVYMNHSEWGRAASGGSDNFMADIRSLNLPQTWAITVVEKTLNTNVDLKWDLSEASAYGRCNGALSFTLTDGSTGASVDMDTAPSYTYYSSSASPRTMTVTAVKEGDYAKLAATESLTAKLMRNGTVALAWKVVAGAKGYRVYRESNGISILVSGENLIPVPKGGVTYVRYTDTLAAKGKRMPAAQYVYSVVAVDANGCAGNYKTGSAAR